MIKSCLIVEKAICEKRVYPFYTRLTIGRAPNNDVCLPDRTVSKRHAIVGRVKGETIVKDMDSHNGTYINGEKIREAVISGGDNLKIGGVSLRFYQEEGIDASRLSETLVINKGRRKLGEYLKEAGIIDEHTLQTALDKKDKKQKIGEMLVEMGVADPEDIANAFAKQLKLTFMSLKELEIPEDVSSLIPAGVAETHLLVPVEVTEGRLLVAMVDPLDSYAIQVLRVVAGMKVDIAVATREDVLEAMGRCYPLECLEKVLDTDPYVDDVVIADLDDEYLED
jgi:hypothetical protein